MTRPHPAHRSGRKITALAVTDYPSAKLAQAANIECLLVGDSIGMTVFGCTDLLGRATTPTFACHAICWPTRPISHYR